MATFVWAAAANSTWATGSNWKVAGVAQANPPTAADDAVFGTGTGATNSNCSTANGDVCRSLNVDNAYTGTMTLANSLSALNVGDASGGALTLGSGMTLTAVGGNSAFNLVASSTNGGAGWPITTNGVSMTVLLRANNAGGRWTQQDNITFSVTGSALGVRVTAGTYDVNGKTVTTGKGCLVDGGTIVFGAASFVYTATAAATLFTYTSGTVTGGSETHSLTGTGNNVRTFAGGGQTYGTIRHDAASGTGALTITGADTFTAIGNVTGRTVTLPASTTTTVNGANGLGGIKGTLNSSTSGTAATVNLTSTQVSVMRAATLKDITVTPNGHAYALDASVSTSGNAGITFNTPFGWGAAA